MQFVDTVQFQRLRELKQVTLKAAEIEMKLQTNTINDSWVHVTTYFRYVTLIHCNTMNLL